MNGFLRVDRSGGEPRLRLRPGDGQKEQTVGQKSLDASLAARSIDELDALCGPQGLAVDFEIHNGQPRAVRAVGVAARLRAAGVPARDDRFLNPYTFVPAPGRAATGALADGEPPGHDLLAAERWTGRIAVRLETVTPLLVLDTEHPHDGQPGKKPVDPSQEHATFDVRMSPDGSRPDIAPTGIKGMLRSAYEAVTNSRFGVFTGHDQRLAYRMEARAGIKAVPARVTDDGGNVQLLPGMTEVGRQEMPNPVLHAAWLPTYEGSPFRRPAQTFPHGTKVKAQLQLVQHLSRSGQGLRPDFRYWLVLAMAPAGDEPLPVPTPARDPGQRGRSHHQPLDEFQVVSGWVFVTNQNIDRKHDERVFFCGTAFPAPQPLDDALKSQWTVTIKSYQDAHDDAELFDRRDATGRRVGPDRYIGPEPGKTAWSPHVYARRGGREADQGRDELRPGSLCYAHVDGQGRVVKLLPVSIARELFGRSPAELLDDGHKPARSVAELSPADRVFGWVRQGKARPGRGADQAAYRGNLRVGPVRCVEGGAEHFATPLNLEILGQPKPQYARFYVGQGGGTSPLGDGLQKQAWYGPGQSLRGWKVYLHHAGLPDDYWQPEWQSESLGGHLQEYRRLDGQPDRQSRSITGWVKPRSAFNFVIDVKNLHDAELGALLWLLSLPDGHYHRLGYAKPLGFGSVRLSVDWGSTALSTGGKPGDSKAGTWSAYWSSLEEHAAPARPAETVMATIEAYKSAVAEPQRFEDVPYIRAFLASSKGDPTLRVHYPRVWPGATAATGPVPRDPELPSYKWFVANEQYGDKLSLPQPWERGLPVLPGDRPPTTRRP